MNEFEYVKCDICGSDRTELLYPVAECTGLYPGETFNLVRCKNCGLVYMNPRPRKEELNKYYPEESYYAYQSGRNKKAQLRNRIKYFLLEWLEGYRVYENNRLIHINRVITRFVGVIFKDLLRCIIPYQKHGKLLDIGCGNGTFLKWYKDHGWDVYGVEVSRKAIEICKQQGIKVFYGELLDAHLGNETFDVVTLMQVLEHFPNPSAILKEISRILKMDGYAIIAVPNFGGFDRKVLKSNWGHLDVPRHLYHFELETLNKLLRNCGLRIQKVKAKIFDSFSMKRNLNRIRRESFVNYMKCLLILIALKPILLTVSKKRQERFGVYICVYCRKMT